MRRGHILRGDLLVVKDGATTGKVAFVGPDFPFARAVANEHVFVCRAQPGIEPKFLFYFLFSSVGQREILNNFRGSAQGGINLSFAEGATVPVAPTDEQRRIVESVDALLDQIGRIENRVAQARAVLRRFRLAVLAAAFSGRLTADWRDQGGVGGSVGGELARVEEVRRAAWQRSSERRGHRRRYVAPVAIDEKELPPIPESWKWSSADALCEQITDGEHIQPKYQSAGYPMLTAKHIRDGFVVFDDHGLIAEEDFLRALERCAPQPDDVLIVSVGATTGRAAIVNQGAPAFAIVRSVLLLRPVIDPRYFLRWAQSPWCLRWMTNASGASAQPHLYINDTKRMPVPVAPPAEEAEIVRRIGDLYALGEAIEERLRHVANAAASLRQSVLKRAFSGDLVAQESGVTDVERSGLESAAQLIERVASTSVFAVGGRSRRVRSS